MDYAMPRASNMPDLDVTFNQVLEPTNELGVKGIGEGGACASPHAVVNAVLDALAHAGVAADQRMALQMPLTAPRLWQCLRTAGHPAAQ
jgi:carbon-monoxide dehydrogenase large subunit